MVTFANRAHVAHTLEFTFFRIARILFIFPDRQHLDQFFYMLAHILIFAYIFSPFPDHPILPFPDRAHPGQFYWSRISWSPFADRSHFDHFTFFIISNSAVQSERDLIGKRSRSYSSSTPLGLQNATSPPGSMQQQEQQEDSCNGSNPLKIEQQRQCELCNCVRNLLYHRPRTYCPRLSFPQDATKTHCRDRWRATFLRPMTATHSRNLEPARLISAT